MKSYGEYKKTTYDWWPIVPAHWDHITIRSLMQTSDIRCGMRSDLELLSVYREYGVIKKNSRDDNHNKPSLDISNYKYVGRDFVVMNKMKMWQGSLGVSAFEGIVSPAYIVCTIRKKLNSNYLNYLLRSHPFKTFYNRISYGIRVGQWDLRYDDLKTLNLFLPSREEQDQIVRYLDAKVGNINKLIKIKQPQIALLKDKKQAIINQSVTRGLDPNAPMKDSGIAWIGQIPEGWEVRPIGSFATVGNGSTPLRSNGRYWDNGTYPWLNSSYANYETVDEATDFVTEYAMSQCHLPIVKPQSLIIGLTGQGKTRGMVSIMNIEATINQHLAFITVNEAIVLPRFLRYFLSAMYEYIRMVSDGNGCTKGGLTCTMIRCMKSIVPSLETQKFILHELDHAMLLFRECQEILDREVSTLTEYRARLISDVVTGKVDVRGLAVPDTFEEEEENAMDGHPWLAQADEDEYSVADMEK